MRGPLSRERCFGAVRITAFSTESDPQRALALVIQRMRMIKTMKACVLVLAVATCASRSNAEIPDEWIALGARIHGAFGAFIPVGIKIGLDAIKRLNANPREVTVLYYDSDSSPCACFADGVAIATYASI